MMLRILSIFLLSSLCVAVHGQNQKIDSLESLSRMTKTDTSLIDLYGQLSEEYIKVGDSTQAFRTAYHALDLAEKVNDHYFRAIAYNSLGFSYLKLLNLDSVKYYYFKTLDVLKQDTSSAGMKMKVIANNNIAFAYSLDGNMKKALQLIIANLPIIHELGDEQKYKTTVHNIAAAFVSSGENDKAYPYMKEDVALADQGDFSDESKAETYMSAAFLFYKTDSLDQTGSMLKKSLQYLEKLGDHYLWGRYYTIQARYLVKLDKISEARTFLNKAWSEVERTKNGTNEYDYFIAKTDVEWASGNFKEARDAIFKLYHIDKQHQNYLGLLTTVKDIALLSREMGDYKTALQYMEEYASLKDSIDHKQTLMDMTELEVQYRTSEKEKQILQLESEKQQAALTQKNQRLLQWLFGIGTAILLLAFIFASYIYRSKQRQTASKLEELKKQRQLDLTQAVLEGEERERQRIARDLHDGLGGTLSGIKIKLSGEHRERGTPVINETISQLENSIGELRRIARNMMPGTLIRSGLEVALRDLCVSLSSDHTDIEFQPGDIQKDIPVESQVNIYRMVQELLSNAIRHAEATKIIVQCIHQANNFLITAEDNGRGFDIENQSKSKGIGLDNIRNRVNLMKGNMQINSTINKGTTVNIELAV